MSIVFTIGILFPKINKPIEEITPHTQATSLPASAYRNMKTLYTINIRTHIGGATAVLLPHHQAYGSHTMVVHYYI